MTKSDARNIADIYLRSLEEESDLELAINDDITEEHQDGFVFFYNTKDYWRTRDAMTSLAGNGPIFVKGDGAVVILPTNQSIDLSLQNL